MPDDADQVYSYSKFGGKAMVSHPAAMEVTAQQPTSGSEPRLNASAHGFDPLVDSSLLHTTSTGCPATPALQPTPDFSEVSFIIIYQAYPIRLICRHSCVLTSRQKVHILHFKVSFIVVQIHLGDEKTTTNTQQKSSLIPPFLHQSTFQLTLRSLSGSKLGMNWILRAVALEATPLKHVLQAENGRVEWII